MTVFLVCTLCAASPAPHAAFRPVSFDKVRLEKGFWGRRWEVNRKETVPHNLTWCEKTGRIKNFAQAAGIDKSPYRGHYFHDSDVYKVLEGVASTLAVTPDAPLEAQLDRIIELIAKAQQPDGYLNTWFTCREPDKRWQDIRVKHELYCAGHLFEAAAAHFQATGKRTFLDVACRLADHIDRTFGPGKRHAVPGHEEIELALVKLWRATGEKRYLALSRFFVEEHGRADTHELFGAYCQDHLPIRKQSEPRGHAVRFMYLYSAVADHCAIRWDQGFADAMERLWQNIVRKRMYVTGGVGVRGHGEGFARPWYLPNYEAYCETCASIASVFWNHRLALLHGEGRFADLAERLLYNGALSGVSLNGRLFFYVNPLASRGNHHRRPWYGCACCPTNVVRFIAAVGQYFYAQPAGGNGVVVLQYAPSTVTLPVGGGTVTVRQETRYPWDGTVRITVTPRGGSTFPLLCRIPAWCEKPAAQLNGTPVSLSPRKGFASLKRQWKAGDTLTLTFPMSVRRVKPHPKVEANRGRRAFMRGPVVYCFEDCDNPCPVDQVAVPEDAPVREAFRPDLLGGVVVLQVEGMRTRLVEAPAGGVTVRSEPVNLTAVPYYAWDNREPGRMVVWVPLALKNTPNLKNATAAVFARPSASHVCPRDSLSALNDAVLPRNSIDHSIARFTWWDHRGTKEWVQYTFAKLRTFSRAAVYWFDDTGRGSCRVPASWRLLYQEGSTWRPVETTDTYGVAKDTFNVVRFTPVRTKALRLEVTLQRGFSGGILEWQVSQ